jgi:hypothetical protein
MSEAGTGDTQQWQHKETQQPGSTRNTQEQHETSKQRHKETSSSNHSSNQTKAACSILNSLGEIIKLACHAVRCNVDVAQQKPSRPTHAMHCMAVAAMHHKASSRFPFPANCLHA